MPLSWNEIKTRALAFSREWKGEGSERAEAQSFWNGFFHVFGIDRRRVAIFEKQVKFVRAGETSRHGRIDGFWKGVLLIEHKSAGEDLDRAFEQATDYFEGLAERDLPRYILVSDFARFRLYDLEADTTVEFKLAQLHDKIKHFGFIAGYRAQEIEPQNPVNIEAAEQMGKLHDLLKASGYVGHPLELLLVRVLFCLFADDTGIFQPAQAFRMWLDERTAADGSDLGSQLAQLFQVLNQKEGDRPKTLDEQLRAFPYVNGKLFEEPLPIASFDGQMRETLLDCCALDWSSISPAVFGALFQSIMDDTARRNLGAHYTSEENILKLIKPLFLDALWEEFHRIKGNKNRLFDFHKRLRALTFLDPACGCGNFLVISYRELRKLELEILRTVHEGPGSRFLNIHQEIQVDVDQFYGIEIEEFPAQIAQVALWLMDHQMNMRISEEFGLYFARIPLVSAPHIHHANALRIDWAGVLPAERCSYVLGNPPFVGKTYQTEEQKDDLRTVLRQIRSAGLLDLVTAWYVLAARYIRGTRVRCAFVSTNSITQGEQVGVLWGYMIAQGMSIWFAHRPFQWSNEGRGVATVQCVIVGFAAFDISPKTIYEYDDVRGVPHSVAASNINPYLVDAPTVMLEKRDTPLAAVAQMRYGSKPADGGFLILSEGEQEELLASAPALAHFVRPYVGADELLYGRKRYCLWLHGAGPSDLRDSTFLRERVQAVQDFRLKSSDASTRRWADFPTLFQTDRQPATDYFALPEVSSERRRYLPVAIVPATTIASNKVYTVAGATMFEFGMLVSSLHFAWMAYTSGRLESRFQYSVSLTYNTFPWLRPIGGTERRNIEAAAQGVLDARAQFPDASLADLYDPLTMPPALVKAHQKLDAVVDAAYLAKSNRKGFKSDAQRVAFLFELYQKYTSLLPAAPQPRRSRRRAPPV